MKKLLWKIYSFIGAERKSRPGEEKELIDSFPEPESGYERSYYNYCINKRFRSRLYIILSNLAGIIALPFFISGFFINGKKIRSLEHHEAVILHTVNRTGLRYRIDDRIPGEIGSEFKDVFELELESYPGFKWGILDKKAFGIWKKYTSAHPFCGFLNLRCLIHIAAIERIIREYSPKAIVNSRMELNNISSVITDYCEENGVEHICFMHGETLTNVKTAFVSFSRFYIWDEHYIEVFDWSRCRHDQYRTYVPDIFRKTGESGEIAFEYMYALSGAEEKNNTLGAVAEAVNKLAAAGHKVKIRPHPRWSDMNEIKRVFDGNVVIEDPGKIAAPESIGETENIIGIFSTMLAEAYYAGKGVVIDDVSDVGFFKELEDKKYILLGKKHRLLSELTDEITENRENTYAQ